MSKSRIRKLHESFLHAFRGLRLCITGERNFRVHMTAAFYVTAAALMGRVSATEAAVLCLCFGLGASVDEAQDLLRHARLAPLYSRDRRDAIVIFGLSHGMALAEINDKLYAEDADTLC